MRKLFRNIPLLATPADKTLKVGMVAQLFWTESKSQVKPVDVKVYLFPPMLKPGQPKFQAVVFRIDVQEA